MNFERLIVRPSPDKAMAPPTRQPSLDNDSLSIATSTSPSVSVTEEFSPSATKRGFLKRQQTNSSEFLVQGAQFLDDESFVGTVSTTQLTSTGGHSHSVRWEDEDGGDENTLSSTHHTHFREERGSVRRSERTLAPRSESSSFSVCSRASSCFADCVPEGSLSLTFFQASPLVMYPEGEESLEPCSVESLEVEREQEMIAHSILSMNPAVQIKFEMATLNRFGAFFSMGKERALHFSCHGGANAIGLDDGWGTMIPLELRHIKEWMRDCTHALDFVFISACHSRSIGNAFAEAGVPHVVCCGDDSDGGRIRSDVALEFESAFYEACACGQNISDSFDLACKRVLTCPSISEDVRIRQVNQFFLLPEGVEKKHHSSFCLFSADKSGDVNDGASVDESTYSNESRTSFGSEVYHSFPRPPDLLVGRRVDKHNILSALRCGSRVVRVFGEKGVGKRSIVQSCCKRLQTGSELNRIDCLLWAPRDGDPVLPSDSFSPLFSSLSYVMRGIQDKTMSCHTFQHLHRQNLSKICWRLRRKSTLLVFDAVDFGTNETEKLVEVVHHIIKKTKEDVKIIVILEEEAEKGFYAKRLPCVESGIRIGLLPIKEAIFMFASLCPHVKDKVESSVGSARQLYDLLVPEDQITRRSKRLTTTFDTIGGGNPERILQVAKKMTAQEYRDLIRIGRQKEILLSFGSRAEINVRLRSLRLEIEERVSSKCFEEAHELQILLQEIESMKPHFPHLWELESQSDVLLSDLEAAVEKEDFLLAGQISHTQKENQRRLEKEREAMVTCGLLDAMDDILALQARCNIDRRISMLSEELQRRSKESAYGRCSEINEEINQLRILAKLRPTLDEMVIALELLHTELARCQADNDWEAAKKVSPKIGKLQLRLEVERSASMLTDGDTRILQPADELRGTGACPNVETSSEIGSSARGATRSDISASANLENLEISIDSVDEDSTCSDLTMHALLLDTGNKSDWSNPGRQSASAQALYKDGNEKSLCGASTSLSYK